MRKITALKLQKRNRNRVNVYLDGEFAFGMAKILVGWLRIGQEISDEKIAELQKADALEVAYERALNFISYRPRSSSEVRRNLRKHKVDEAHIEATINRLIENRWLDDQKFAELWVENRVAFRPRGRRALRMELRQKGVDADAIEAVIEDLDEDTLAYEAGQKQMRKIRTDDFQTFRKKMYGFLSRRGFNYATISPVVQKLWREYEDNHEETT